MEEKATYLDINKCFQLVQWRKIWEKKKQYEQYEEWKKGKKEKKKKEKKKNTRMGFLFLYGVIMI